MHTFSSQQRRFRFVFSIARPSKRTQKPLLANTYTSQKLDDKEQGGPQTRFLRYQPSPVLYLSIGICELPPSTSVRVYNSLDYGIRRSFKLRKFVREQLLGTLKLCLGGCFPY